LIEIKATGLVNSSGQFFPANGFVRCGGAGAPFSALAVVSVCGKSPDRAHVFRGQAPVCDENRPQTIE